MLAESSGSKENGIGDKNEKTPGNHAKEDSPRKVGNKRKLPPPDYDFPPDMMNLLFK